MEYTEEFEGWWNGLSTSEQARLAAMVGLLEERGPHLDFPYSSQVKGSRFAQMRELRAQLRGDPVRVLYAFDPRRCAILLLGGNKTGDDRWYEVHVPRADRIFEQHLKAMEEK